MLASAVCALVPALLAAPSLAATDWLVDASGATSPFTTIEAAMVQASPGDRILVQPGSYPAFHFSRGVDVIGLGSDPGQVQIERVDFHPNLPILGFEAGLENVSICGQGPGFSISGNELSGGTLVIDGVRMCGGTFLYGSSEFYVLVIDSELLAGPGDGFQNVAFDFRGGVLDLVDTRIVAADASPTMGTPAGTALRLLPGATARVSGCEIEGGIGSAAPGLLHGGTGILKASGAAPVTLRLAGGTNVVGGNAPLGTGGAGVAVTGTVQVGDAQVLGGQGASDGADFSGAQPAYLSYDPHLRLVPAEKFAQGSAFLHPNQSVKLVSDTSLTTPMLGFAGSLDSPSLPTLSPLVASGIRLVPLSSWGVKSPGVLGSPSGLPSKRLYAQVFFPDPDSRTGETISSNPVAITIAH